VKNKLPTNFKIHFIYVAELSTQEGTGKVFYVVIMTFKEESRGGEKLRRYIIYDKSSIFEK